MVKLAENFNPRGFARPRTAAAPMQSPTALETLGYRLVLYPISALLAAARSAQRVYAGILAGKPEPTVERVTFAGYNDIVGLNAYLNRD